MTSTTLFRRTAIAVGATVAAAGILAGCGPSDSTATPSPVATSTPATAGTHLISSNGHKVAFQVTPGRLPAIVLDAGGGADSSYWKNLAPVLAKSTGSEIITYDREGMGASDEVPGPWKVENAVSDLETGLTELGATKVILVSHSEAGEIATYFADQHPDQVSGAVLVDASLPQFYTDSEIARVAAATQPQVDALKKKPNPTKPERQLLAVAADYVPEHKAYHKMTWPSGVSATVIASAQTPFPTSPPDAQAWRNAQAEFAKAAGNRRLVTAANTSHDVALDNPGLVQSEVEAMVKSAD
ncbi:alpha/beta fold hydrolase [Kribbella sp. NPDC048928]|uniref:alpha/beta fold hydrolase n=1 Tax=Kribbella sp. NPDC048928 TaxID=3364111 RepID=UPI003722AEC0